MKIFKRLLYLIVASVSIAAMGHKNDNIVEEVAWVIGDEPLYKSEIEQAYQDMVADRVEISGDPYCVIPEQIAIERLFLHQADLDTIEVSESMIMAQVDQQMNFLVNQLGSREKVEQYFRKPFPQIRDYYATNLRNRGRISQVRSELTKDVKATPSDIRRYFSTLPEDSIPFIPLQVEAQIITLNPLIPRQEIDDIKARLRDFADRVNKGEADFSTLAILYSEAPEGMRGGEIGFLGRGQLVPEYAAVAFNLNDPKKVSKIVQTEYGFHIIQLIEKRGDRINTRHILLRPKVSEKDLTDALTRLDSVRSEILNKKISFEEAARYISQDKDTRFSKGVMVNNENGTTRFEMSELPQEVARAIADLKPGEISKPFIMRSKTDREIVAMVLLTSRNEAHRANMADDFQTIKNMYENAQKEAIIDKWLEKKIKETYIRIEDGWKDCEFQHDGWVKSK